MKPLKAVSDLKGKNSLQQPAGGSSGIAWAGADNPGPEQDVSCHVSRSRLEPGGVRPVRFRTFARYPRQPEEGCSHHPREMSSLPSP